MEEHWKKIIAEHASDVLDNVDLSAAASALLTPETRPEAFIRSLSTAELWVDAAKVMAHALPRREAVWWACMCASHMEALVGEKDEQRALTAAERWVYQPTDEHQLDAFRAVQESRSNSAGTLCALTAAYSGESLSTSEDQKIEIKSADFPNLVFAIVMMAANEKGSSHMTERLQNFLQGGEEIACGGTGKMEDMDAPA